MASTLQHNISTRHLHNILIHYCNGYVVCGNHVILKSRHIEHSCLYLFETCLLQLSKNKTKASICFKSDIEPVL